MTTVQADACPTCGSAWAREVRVVALAGMVLASTGGGPAVPSGEAVTRRTLYCAEGHEFVCRMSVECEGRIAYSVVVPDPPPQRQPWMVERASGPCVVCGAEIQPQQLYVGGPAEPRHVWCRTEAGR